MRASFRCVDLSTQQNPYGKTEIDQNRIMTSCFKCSQFIRQNLTYFFFNYKLSQIFPFKFNIHSKNLLPYPYVLRFVIMHRRMANPFPIPKLCYLFPVSFSPMCIFHYQLYKQNLCTEIIPLKMYEINSRLNANGKDGHSQETPFQKPIDQAMPDQASQKFYLASSPDMVVRCG